MMKIEGNVNQLLITRSCHRQIELGCNKRKHFIPVAVVVVEDIIWRAGLDVVVVVIGLIQTTTEIQGLNFFF